MLLSPWFTLLLRRESQGSTEVEALVQPRTHLQGGVPTTHHRPPCPVTPPHDGQLASESIADTPSAASVPPPSPEAVSRGSASPNRPTIDTTQTGSTTRSDGRPVMRSETVSPRAPASHLSGNTVTAVASTMHEEVAQVRVAVHVSIADRYCLSTLFFVHTSSCCEHCERSPFNVCTLLWQSPTRDAAKRGTVVIGGAWAVTAEADEGLAQQVAPGVTDCQSSMAASSDPVEACSTESVLTAARPTQQ